MVLVRLRVGRLLMMKMGVMGSRESGRGRRRGRHGSARRWQPLLLESLGVEDEG